VIERVGIINHGRVVAFGTPGELKAHVDRRIHLELVLAEGQEALGSAIPSLGEAKAVTERQWIVLAERDNIGATIDRVLHTIGLDRLDDFRILTPSLEDVYLEIAGEALKEEA
jgi:ABC-2 type transport system ATP-binding protein